MTQAQHIQLVAIAARENEAAAIESFLRDRGQPVRMQWLQPVEDLEEQLTKLAPDLIFCEANDSKRRDYALHCCNKVAAEVPVLMLVQEINAEAVETALQKRARDAVCPGHMEHLQAVYLRELAAAKLEANLREARREVHGLQARLDSLVSVSQLAVAHLQDGILQDASEDFSELFGYASASEVNEKPFLELIHADERGPIKKLLNRCAAGKIQEEDIETCGVSADGGKFSLQLRMAYVKSEDGNAVEIQVSRNDQAPATAAQATTTSVSTAPAPAMADEAKPAPPVAEQTEAEEQLAIDERLTQQITAALESGRVQSQNSQLIYLDGQVGNFTELSLELQDEQKKRILAPLNNRASDQAQSLLNKHYAQALKALFKQQDGEGIASTVLMPLYPAGLPDVDTLKLQLTQDCELAFKAGHKLVLALGEQAYSKNIQHANSIVKALRPLGVMFALDNARANPMTLKMLETIEPDYICLDRSATQLLISQGSEHAELSRILQQGRDGTTHIVAFPLQDAHSMAMLWQRGVNMVRGSVPQWQAAA